MIHPSAFIGVDVKHIFYGRVIVLTAAFFLSRRLAYTSPRTKASVKPMSFLFVMNLLFSRITSRLTPYFPNTISTVDFAAVLFRSYCCYRAAFAVAYNLNRDESILPCGLSNPHRLALVRKD